MRARHILLLAALACSLAAPARDKADKADKGGDILAKAITYYESPASADTDEQAWKLFNEAHAKGSSRAQYYIARMYREGRHVSEDPTQYLSNLREAAAHNDTEAMTELGVLNLYGDRYSLVTRNEAAGVNLLTKAAEAGQPKALLNLGYAYASGLGGLATDKAKAYDLYCRAARAGNVQADVERAKCLAFGIGVKTDTDQAMRLLASARDKGCAEAYSVTADIHTLGKIDGASDTLAIEYYDRAVAMGYNDAAASLAWMHVNGLGTGINYREAYSLFSKAADAGVARGYTGKALCHEFTRGIHFDPQEAVTCYMLGAEHGDASAYYRLYDIYRQGKYDRLPDSQLALSYLNKGVDANDADALYGLGREYMLGTLLDKDTARGLGMIKEAADAGSIEAAAWYGNELYSGKGDVPRDFDKAFVYLNMVAERPAFVDHDVLAIVYRNLSACYRFGRGTATDLDAAEYFAECSRSLGNDEMRQAQHYRQYIDAK